MVQDMSHVFYYNLKGCIELKISDDNSPKEIFISI